MSAAMDTTADSTSSAVGTAAVAATGTRADGRLSSELRPLSVEHGLLARADGSVQWTQGGTSVLVGVYGPVVGGPVRDEKADRAAVVVNFKAANGQANNIDIERGSYIRQSFEPLLVLRAHPRCKINIHIQVVRDCGGVLAAAINATTLALMDAGISSTALLSGVAIAACEQDAQLGVKAAPASEGHGLEFLLDPIAEEVDTSAASTTLAFASTSGGVILSVMESGALDQQALFDAMQLGRAACAHVQQFMKLSLERRTTGTAAV